MFGRLHEAGIEKVIRENFIGRLGCHANGKTYILPISYPYDGTTIYVHSHEDLKIDIMRNNHNVCFQVDSMKDMADWQSVLLWESFEELTDDEDQKAAMQHLMSRELPPIASETVKLSLEWPFNNADLSTISGIFFKVNINEKTGR